MSTSVHLSLLKLTNSLRPRTGFTRPPQFRSQLTRLRKSRWPDVGGTRSVQLSMFGLRHFCKRKCCLDFGQLKKKTQKKTTHHNSYSSGGQWTVLSMKMLQRHFRVLFVSFSFFSFCACACVCVCVCVCVCMCVCVCTLINPLWDIRVALAG